jgi:hypothetical protein
VSEICAWVLPWHEGNLISFKFNGSELQPNPPICNELSIATLKEREPVQTQPLQKIRIQLWHAFLIIALFLATTLWRAGHHAVQWVVSRQLWSWKQIHDSRNVRPDQKFDI